jgi:predicted amidohydrolase
MQNIIKTAAVNFKAEYADKAANLEKILYYINEAAREKSDIIVLPELCLTGYDVFTTDELSAEEKSVYCESVMGKSMEKIRSAVEKCGVYAVVGFGESSNGAFYNSVSCISPNGDTSVYRKIHLFGREGLFFTRGDRPLIFDTPWGKTSVGICYDTYNFPELLRYYACKGARLYLNPTAMAFECYAEGAKQSFCNYYKTTLEYNVINTGMFIVSSDLTGIDKSSRFGGGSVIIGVGESSFKRPEVKYYAGDIKNEAEGMFTAEIDLSRHNPRLFVPSPITGEVDFRPELYAKFYE